MSIAEELHKTIDELSEEQQQELLQTARQLSQKSASATAETSEEEAETELNEELIRRYHHLGKHPEQVVSARESNQQVRDKYGWQ